MGPRVVQPMSASLIGRRVSSAFRLSTTSVSMSLTGSCFSSESAPRPFHHGIRRQGGTILATALPSECGRVQADSPTHLIHRPARDIIPLLGGARGFLLCCRCRGLFSGPAELSAVHPYAVHDHSETTGQGDDRLLHPAAPCDLHRPGLEP